MNMNDLVYCKITEDTFIEGKAALKDKKYAVDPATLKQLVRCDKAEPCAAPKNAATPKPQAVEVED